MSNRIKVYCAACGGEVHHDFNTGQHDYSLRGDAARPYHHWCRDNEPPRTSLKPGEGRGYYEEDAPGYDEAS